MTLRVSFAVGWIFNSMVGVACIRSSWCSRWGLDIVACFYLVRIALGGELSRVPQVLQ